MRQTQALGSGLVLGFIRFMVFEASHVPAAPPYGLALLPFLGRFRIQARAAYAPPSQSIRASAMNSRSGL